MLIVVWGYCYGCFFFFKQKTAYEMRISDWSSDVCSSDLLIYPVSRSGGIGGSYPKCSSSPKFSKDFPELDLAAFPRRTAAIFLPNIFNGHSCLSETSPRSE